MPKLTKEFLQYVKSKGRMTPGEARSTRKARIEELAANLTQPQIYQLVNTLVRQAECPTPDEEGKHDDECEHYWAAYGTGEIEFARDVLSKCTNWAGAPIWPTDNNL